MKNYNFSISGRLQDNNEKEEFFFKKKSDAHISYIHPANTILVERPLGTAVVTRKVAGLKKGCKGLLEVEEEPKITRKPKKLWLCDALAIRNLTYKNRLRRKKIESTKGFVQIHNLDKYFL